jgi:hypothetical protein
MKTRLLLIIFFVFISFGSVSAALAHQPRYVTNDQLVLIKNPAVSQAFYGELKGQPAYYLIDLKQPEDLYFQILEPDLPEIQKDKTVAVDYALVLSQPAENFITISPDSDVWKSFYEEYAGDKYLEGPAAKKFGEAGYYTIKISSPENVGKYVLVVGEKEEFPVEEIAKALITIPQLKTKFFNKPLWQSFEGRIGKYFGFSLLILIIFIFLFRRFHRTFR